MLESGWVARFGQDTRYRWAKASMFICQRPVVWDELRVGARQDALPENQMLSSRKDCSMDLLTAPTFMPWMLPSRKTMSVGMPRTP